MLTIVFQLIGLLGMLACIAFATLALNRNRKTRQFARRVFRRLQ